MPEDAGTSGLDRALPPPDDQEIMMPMWFCPICNYSTPGTIDEPYAGDGTCENHPSEKLRLARADDPLAGSGRGAESAH